MWQRSGAMVRLSGGEQLCVYPRWARELEDVEGEPVHPIRIAGKVREAVLGTDVTEYLTWVGIYEWLGPPLPKPPRPHDLSRMVTALETAFRQGTLVAFRGPYDVWACLARDANDWGGASPRTEREPQRERPAGEAVGTTWFALRVVDEVGDGIEGIELTYEVLGEKREATTNAAGEARIDTLSTGFASAAVKVLDGVRATLKARWEEAREAKILEGPRVIVRELGEGVLEPIALECEKVTTLVITPAAWIGIQLVDEEGAPVGGRPYRIVTPNGEALDGVLDAEGSALHAGVRPGRCEVFCPYSEARGEVTHEVEAGEHISGIAQRYGFDDYTEVWEYGGNAALRELRPNPNELIEGDVVLIPPIEAKGEARMTGLHHVFTVKRSPLELRLKLLRWPRKLEVERLCELLDAIRATDRDGIVEAPVEKTAHAAALVHHAKRTALAIGYLTPLDDESGAGWRARLQNLGFLFDREDDDDEELRFALEDFQAEYRLMLSGEYDEKTKAKLEDVYGC